jgi:pimeloyl-ACP methyl ester carboxylesterase
MEQHLMESHVVDLNGPVHYVDFGGAGPTVVLVHGLGGSHVNWHALGPRLAEHARVLAPDLAGFGRTPLAGRVATVSANRRLLDRFLVDVAGTPAILVGNSMGGMISLLEAGAAHDRVAGLVLIDPSLPRGRSEPIDGEIAKAFGLYAVPGLGERYLRARRAQLGPEGLVRETLRLCTVDPTAVPEDLQRASEAFARERAEMAWGDRAFLQAARSILRVLARRERYLATIRSIRVPVLLLHGAQDRLVPVAAARRIAALRPDWTVEVLDGIGHVPQIEAPERVAGLLTEWFSGSGAAAVAACQSRTAG